jgi:hypothetical protein
MREEDTPQRERQMARLVPIQYELDEHELPDHLYLTGKLDIEIDCVDGLPYIYALELMVHNGETGISVEHDYRQGRKDNWHSSVELKNDLHRDKKLMDDIYDKCAVEGMWE